MLKCGAVSRSGCDLIQCLTIWDFFENDSASYVCSPTRSASDLLVSPIDTPSLPGGGIVTSSCLLEFSLVLGGLHIVQLDS